MMRRVTFLAVLLLFPGATAAQHQPVTIEELLSVPAIAPFLPSDFSADGSLLAYTVVDAGRQRELGPATPISGVPWSAVGADIWITDLRTGVVRNLTGGRGSNWAPRWSPDGNLLAFFSDRVGHADDDAAARPPRNSEADNGVAEDMGPPRLWVWERETETMREVGELEILPSSRGIEWLADGRSILVSVLPQGVSREEFVALREAPKTPKLGEGVTARIYSSDPSQPGATPRTEQSNLDLSRRGLVRVDIGSGVVQWVVPDARVPTYSLSPDRKTFAYANVLGTEQSGSQQFLLDIVAHNLETGDSRVIASRVRGSAFRWNLTWSPHGDGIAYRTSGPAARDEVFIVAPAGDAPRRIAEAPAQEEADYQRDDPKWEPSGRNVLFTRGRAVWRAAADGSGASELARSAEHELDLIATPEGQLWSTDGGKSIVARTLHRTTKQAGFARIDLASGAITPALEQDVRHGGYSVPMVLSPDRRTLAFVSENSTSPAEWWVVSADLTSPRQASRVAPAEFSERAWGTARVIEWRTLDGDTLHGALLYPVGYEEGKRYPLIVKVYGGSALSDSRNRFGLGNAPVDNAQLYATRGYAVLLADSRLHIGSPMIDLLKSVIPGIDRTIDIGVADPDRIGVTGHSYGGYSTISLITQSPRFAAAVMSAGLGNLVSGYGQLAPDGTNYLLPWAETGQGRMGGTPWEHRSRYIENSPSFYLDRVRTPLLIVHGSEDTAVAPFLAEEIFVGLRRLGQTVTYAIYDGEDHWPGTWSYLNQVDVVNRTIQWFDRFLKGEEPKAE